MLHEGAWHCTLRSIFFSDIASFLQRSQQISIQHIFTKGPIGTLNIGILRWFIGLDKSQFNIRGFYPLSQFLRDQLRPLIATPGSKHLSHADHAHLSSGPPTSTKPVTVGQVALRRRHGAVAVGQLAHGTQSVMVVIRPASGNEQPIVFGCGFPRTISKPKTIISEAEQLGLLLGII